LLAGGFKDQSAAPRDTPVAREQPRTKASGSVPKILQKPER
jgi:hypothetical protein